MFSDDFWLVLCMILFVLIVPWIEAFFKYKPYKYMWQAWQLKKQNNLRIRDFTEQMVANGRPDLQIKE